MQHKHMASHITFNSVIMMGMSFWPGGFGKPMSVKPNDIKFLVTFRSHFTRSAVLFAYFCGCFSAYLCVGYASYTSIYFPIVCKVVE